MESLGEKAERLRRQASDRGVCAEEAKSVKRRVEDLANAGSTGGFWAGAGLIVVGAVVSFFIPPLGIGIATGGAVAIGLTADNYAEALKKAKKELERAVEDLEECLERHP